MDKEDREDMLTPINGREWPVLIPKNISLDLIRIEMLNLGAEYAWLDVLCLRQEGGPREDLREEEWKVDVPTIGGVYNNRLTGVVFYLSGLGRPLNSKADDLESDRCWFKRAWTLQEMSEDHEVIIVAKEYWKDVCRAVTDAEAGVNKELRGGCVDSTGSRDRGWSQAELLFLYPKPGDGNKIWRPSWKQVMTEELPIRNPLLHRWAYETNMDSCPGEHAYIIESALVRGLSRVDSRGRDRQGEVVVEDDTGTESTFEVFACHQYPIPDGSYMLLGTIGIFEAAEELYCVRWVVGWRLPDQRLKKLSVLEMSDFEKMDDSKEMLDSCGFGSKPQAKYGYRRQQHCRVPVRRGFYNRAPVKLSGMVSRGTAKEAHVTFLA
ncbi:hypothetical protein EV421DRAFT_2037654 [Armillaria borealis]|uniref:Heterokaryon incompatibility domain-containing protein n=1 Tax=Armillaria borealis TaxID=47425 RepID=A0AA39MLZ4_9AGAR|nr:hypothetical protein EV421DRAFT_2037654 [Armillaria borealis]